MRARSGRRITPFSVTRTSTRSAGVRSKAGFQARAPGCRHPALPDAQHLPGSALFDRYRAPLGAVEVDAARGGHHHEADAVVGGAQRQRVGPDLVGDVAVRGDPIRAHDDPPDAPSAQEKGGGAVREQVHRDPVPHELPGGEPCTLQPGPGLGRIDRHDLPVPEGAADDTERGAEAAGSRASRCCSGSGPRSARRSALRQAPPCWRLAARSSAWMASASAISAGSGPSVARPAAPAHASQGPGQIDCGGSGGGEPCQIRFQRVSPGAGIGPPGPARREHRAVGGTDPDGGSTAHRHVPDRARHLARAAAFDPVLARGQLPLIQKREGLAGPTQRADGVERPNARYPIRLAAGPLRPRGTPGRGSVRVAAGRPANPSGLAGPTAGAGHYHQHLPRHGLAPARMQPADTLIAAPWIVPVEPAGTILEDHALRHPRGTHRRSAAGAARALPLPGGDGSGARYARAHSGARQRPHSCRDEPLQGDGG